MVYPKEDIIDSSSMDVIYEKDKAYEAYKVDIEDWIIKSVNKNNIYNWKFIQQNFYFNK